MRSVIDRSTASSLQCRMDFHPLHGEFSLGDKQNMVLCASKDLSYISSITLTSDKKSSIWLVQENPSNGVLPRILNMVGGTSSVIHLNGELWIASTGAVTGEYTLLPFGFH